MEPIMELAREHGPACHRGQRSVRSARLYYRFRDGHTEKTGTIGTIGCTSFFPSKNLGCYGDGGAVFCHDDALAERIAMIANHGQKVKYHHTVLGCNSRLDTIQAAVLNAKLPHLDSYSQARRSAAGYYTARLKEIDPEGRFFETPAEAEYSTHVYHQYTLKNQGRAERQPEKPPCRQRHTEHDILSASAAGTGSVQGE